MGYWEEQYGNKFIDIPTTYEDADPSPDLNFWICCGTYELGMLEGQNVSEETQRLAQFFQSKIWNVSLNFYPEGHVFPFWAHTMDELLSYFFPPTFIPPTTTPTATYSFYVFPVLVVLLIASLYRRKQCD
jgi:hypothetical protein